jgi:hypothetical protein
MFFTPAHSVFTPRQIINDVLSELSDVLIFIDHYWPGFTDCKIMQEMIGSITSSLLLGLSEWKLPYLQFYLCRLKTALAQLMPEAEGEVGEILTDQRKSLEDSLSAIFKLLGEDSVVESHAVELSTNHSIVLDWSSEMAVQLIHENFGQDLAYGQEMPIEKWMKSVCGGMRIIGRYMPCAVEIIAKNLLVIIPLKTREEHVSLSSTPNYVHGTFLASFVRPKLMAEAIVHEVSHDILNKFNMQHQLFCNEEEKYYSPFRKDARPASGLLHAAYSFCNVLQLYAGVSQSEPRLSAWASDNIERYYYNVAVCLALLEHGKDLSVRGMNLVREMQCWLNDFASRQNFKISEEILDERNKHFLFWASTRPEASIQPVRHVIEGLLKNIIVSYQEVLHSKNYQFCVHEMCLPDFILSYRNINEPIIIRKDSVVDLEQLVYALEEFQHEKIKLLESAKHRGFADTPAIFSTLESHIKSFHDEHDSTQYFSVVRDFSSKTDKQVWKTSEFFNDFWLDGGETWFFWNGKGLTVPLHNDSVNNLHCIISGSKSFYLSPPSEEFVISSGDNEYNAGFCAFRPFDDQERAINYGKFIRIDEGDMLYIPSGWWHSVYYHQDSLAISAFDEMAL